MSIRQYNRQSNRNGLYCNTKFYSEGYLYMNTDVNDAWNGLLYNEFYKTLGYLI